MRARERNVVFPRVSLSSWNLFRMNHPSNREGVSPRCFYNHYLALCELSETLVELGFTETENTGSELGGVFVSWHVENRSFSSKMSGSSQCWFADDILLPRHQIQECEGIRLQGAKRMISLSEVLQSASGRQLRVNIQTNSKQ
jgi:hypothetical protein